MLISIFTVIQLVIVLVLVNNTERENRQEKND